MKGSARGMSDTLFGDIDELIFSPHRIINAIRLWWHFKRTGEMTSSLWMFLYCYRRPVASEQRGWHF